MRHPQLDRLIAVDIHGNEVGPNKTSQAQAAMFFNILFGRRAVTIAIERDGTIRAIVTERGV